jgi:DNA-binding SARP family transcriptional activator/tetratricopeptide (TPR) repeat protein
MRFALLGPLQVTDAGEPLDIRGRMPRVVLAVLLLNANTAVSADLLVEALWGDSPPESATASLHNHLARLRRMLGLAGGARIRAVPSGYLVQVEPGELDADRFAGLSAEGRSAAQSGEWQRASADLTAALALWRGDRIADLADIDGQHAQLQLLLETRTQARAGRIEADLHLGRHHELVGELRALTAGQPLAEAFHGQLMLALYRADRRAEALDAFQTLRRTLVTELGIEPSPPVQVLHRRILAADPGLLAPEARAAAAPAAPITPAPSPDRPARLVPASSPAPAASSAPGSGPRFQLPSDTRVFTGRSRELEQLLALGDEAPTGSYAGMVVISAINGMGGVGKSALAVHAAHRMRGLFPDGQLFIDLHGHTGAVEPLSATEALGRLLRSLGTPPQLIPHGVDERAAYYRHRLADTRTLIVLDNASSTAQIRPLLPGGPGCLVVVTSRSQLTGLDDAHVIALDPLPVSEATALLHLVAGPGRVPAGHPAVDELVSLCGHLPLAVRIAAARLRHSRTLRIEDVVDDLRDEQRRLQHLADDDRSLTAVFESSYAALPAAERTLFRCLGLIPGPDVDPHAAANLIGTDRREAERLLESLLDHNLLTQHAAGRYRFHDLVRLYARSLTQDDSAAREEHDAARARLLDYYRYAADAADRHLVRNRRPAVPGAAPVPATAPQLPERAAALAWMRAERDNLIAAAEESAEVEPARAVALTAALAALLDQDGPWSQAATLHERAAGLAQRRGDGVSEANARWALGKVLRATGDLASSEREMERARALYHGLGHRLGEANTLYELGRGRLPTGAFAAASELQERALSIYQDLGEGVGEAGSLYELGRIRYTSGDYAGSIGLYERARVLYRDHGSRPGEASTLWDLGRVRLATGDPAAADENLAWALAIFRDFDSGLGEANVLCALGRVRQVAGDHTAAAGFYERALAIFRDLGHRHGAANALWELGSLRRAAGQYQESAELLERALAAYRELGQAPGEANTMWELGRVRHATGHHRAATELLEQALVISRSVGLRRSETEILSSLGAVVADTTGPEAALVLFQQALAVARELKSPLDEAQALEGAARCAARIGDRAGAIAGLRQAVALYQGIEAPQAVTAAADLADLER